MYRVSDFLPRFALALLAGAGLATLWANMAPADYYDAIEFRLMDLALPNWLAPLPVSLTPLLIVTEALMALFIGVIGKELWEAMVLGRGALRGRHALFPLALALGGMAGGVAVWSLSPALLGTLFGIGAVELPGMAGWTVPLGADVALCYLFGRWIFGPGHPALHLLVLVARACDGLALAALALTEGLSSWRPLWLCLPVLAALAVWRAFGHPPLPGATERQRRAGLRLWPYILAGLVSWAGVVAAGLPGALGLLPVIPAIAHADRSYGVFAKVEEILHDPLNRLAQWLAWPLVPVLFGFGFLHGGIDLSAFAPETLRLLASLWIGRPVGMLCFGLGLAFAVRLPRTAGAGLPQILAICGIMGMAFTIPLVAIETALPGGAMQEAARLGLALSLLAGPMTLLITRLAMRPRKRSAPSH